jgi:hypothetical protein
MPGYAGAGGWGRGGGEAMSKRKLELIEQRKQLDATIGANRDLIDGHARGCRYRELAEVAAQLVKHAQAAIRFWWKSGKNGGADDEPALSRRARARARMPVGASEWTESDGNSELDCGYPSRE